MESQLKNYGVELLRGLNHMLWPAVCLNCHSSVSEDNSGFCNKCWAEMLSCVGGDYCPRCGCDVSQYAIIENACPQCQGEEFHFDKIARAGVYAGSLGEMVLKFKHGQTELITALGRLTKSALEAASFANDIDILVPVPLHWLRRLARGYNQSLLIAKHLKRQGIRISTDLVRIRNTSQQASYTTFPQRIKNVAGAFAVRDGHPFAGRNICLVDDIKTSGATLNECAKVLKEAGAAKVFAAAITVAGQNN